MILTSTALSAVYVKGYTKKNGTYVRGHHRTAPNNTVNDNYSTYGNTNPYTGERGARERESGFGSSFGRSSSGYGNSNNYGEQSGLF